jgi:uncharacterized lipoprotein YddW (UPF0748 family)
MRQLHRLLLVAFALSVGFFPQAGRAQTATPKRLLMWFDGEANFRRFSSPDSIDYYLQKIKDCGFTDAVVDVRPITGEVFFDTPYAPKMKEWNHFTRPDFDYLGRFITTAHRLGLKVQASLNAFVAGHNYFDRGVVYTSHPEWASTQYTPQGMMSITKQKEKYSAMVNPIDKSFRRQFLALLRDLVVRYPQLDGIILDRVRYDGIEADFSKMSRHAFEKYIGQKVKDFPADIFTWQRQADGKYSVQRGKLFNRWIEWRSKVICDFMGEARKAVKDVRPSISFGTYTGAWYPTYYEVGVNFADPSYDPSKDFDWATSAYKTTGYAPQLDLYTTGNYYTDVTIADAQQHQQAVRNETDTQAHLSDWYSVEGSCQKLRGILGGHPFLGGVLVDQFYGHPEKFVESIAMNLKMSDGLMLFDICHIIHKNLWKEVKEGIDKEVMR